MEKTNFDYKVIWGTNHADMIAAKEASDQLMFPDHQIFTPSWSFSIHPGKATEATLRFSVAQSSTQ